MQKMLQIFHHQFTFMPKIFHLLKIDCIYIFQKSLEFISFPSEQLKQDNLSCVHKNSLPNWTIALFFIKLSAWQWVMGESIIRKTRFCLIRNRKLKNFCGIPFFFISQAIDQSAAYFRNDFNELAFIDPYWHLILGVCNAHRLCHEKQQQQLGKRNYS